MRVGGGMDRTNTKERGRKFCTSYLYNCSGCFINIAAGMSRGREDGQKDSRCLVDCVGVCLLCLSVSCRGLDVYIEKMSEQAKERAVLSVAVARHQREELKSHNKEK